MRLDEGGRRGIQDAPAGRGLEQGPGHCRVAVDAPGERDEPAVRRRLERKRQHIAIGQRAHRDDQPAAALRIVAHPQAILAIDRAEAEPFATLPAGNGLEFRHVQAEQPIMDRAVTG